MAERLQAFSAGCPSKIFLTGTSSFLPEIVRGTSGIANTSFGTCRAESWLRIASSRCRLRSSVYSASLLVTTNKAIYDSRPRYSRSMTSESATSSKPSTTRYNSLVPIRMPCRLIVESERP